MAVSENDLEQLDAYLDDALEMGEVEVLRARLAQDAQLLAALEQVRSERAARQALFAALEPDDAAVNALISRVRRSTLRQRQTSRWLRPARWVAAAAACLTIGFFSRGLFDRPAAPANVASTTTKPGVDVKPYTGYQVTLRDDAGRVVAVQQFDSMEKAQEFASDLARWQARSEKLASGHFVLRADRF